MCEENIVSQAYTYSSYCLLIVFHFAFSLEINGGPPVPRRLPMGERTYGGYKYVLLVMLKIKLSKA